MPDKETITRIIVVLITFVNSIYVAKYKGKGGLADNDIYVIASFIALFVSIAINHWYNNSYIKEAKKADEYMAELKGEADEADDEQ